MSSSVWSRKFGLAAVRCFSSVGQVEIERNLENQLNELDLQWQHERSALQQSVPRMPHSKIGRGRVVRRKWGSSFLDTDSLVHRGMISTAPPERARPTCDSLRIEADLAKRNAEAQIQEAEKAQQCGAAKFKRKKSSPIRICRSDLETGKQTKD